MRKENDILDDALSDLDDLLDDVLDDIDMSIENKPKVWQDSLNFLPIKDKLNIVKQIEGDFTKQKDKNYDKRTFSSAYKNNSPLSYIKNECDVKIDGVVQIEQVFKTLLERCPANQETTFDSSLFVKSEIINYFKKQLKHDIIRKIKLHKRDKANISSEQYRFPKSKEHV